MFKVRKVTLPARSQLHSFVAKSDFLDCYAAPSVLPVRDAAEIALAFPAWARALLRVRNLMVAPLGLAVDGPESADKLGLLPIASETDNELIAGFDDKHLNFRISVLTDAGMVYLATWVHPHNIGGHLYLAGVMPFHVAIVRDALRRVVDASQTRLTS